MGVYTLTDAYLKSAFRVFDGDHIFTLSKIDIEEKESMYPVSDKSPDGTKKTYLKIIYFFENEDGQVRKYLTPSMDPKKPNMLWVKMMTGGSIPASALASPEAFGEYQEGFVGKKFKLTCSPSDNGKFTDVLSVSPLRKGDEEEIARKLANTLANDDIEF